MVSGPEKIARNTTYLTVALIIQKVIAFFFFLFIARKLGGIGTGEYVAAFAFSSFFGVFMDFGFSAVLTRELARYPEKSELYLRNSIAVKIVLGILVYTTLLLTIKALDYLGTDHPSLSIVAITGIIMLADSFVLTGISIFRGWQNLIYESIIIIVHKLGVIALGSVVLIFIPSAFNVALAILGGGIFSYILLTHFLSRRVPFPWLPSWNWEIVKSLFLMSLPFALAGFFSTAYAQFDSILLSTYKGSEAVGLYSVAAKTMNAFAFIPSAFIAAMYPAMSSYYLLAPERLTKSLEKSLQYLLIISAPIAVGLYLLADQFVSGLGGDYTSSALAVHILVPSLVFMFLSYPLGAVLNASNRQSWQTSIIGSGLLVNIILNVWLIPKYSFIGSSVAWFITNALVFFLGILLARLIVPYRVKLLLFSVLRVGISVSIMGLVVLITVSKLPLFFVIALAALIYLCLLILTHELKKTDIYFFYRLARPIKNTTN